MFREKSATIHSFSTKAFDIGPNPRCKNQPLKYDSNVRLENHLGIVTDVRLFSGIWKIEEQEEV